MDYLSTQETAKRWGVSLRQVQRLLRAGRIPAARKYGNVWMIPADAEKPTESYGRELSSKCSAAPDIDQTQPDEQTSALPAARPIAESKVRGMLCDTPRLPKNDPDAYADALEEPARTFVSACIAHYRGDSEPLIRCYRTIDNDSEYKIAVATLTMAAAMGTGDFALYDEIDEFFNNLLKHEEDELMRFVLSLPSTMAATAMAVLGMMPDWLRTGDFSSYPRELRPQILHYYLMYLRSMGHYREMLGVAMAAYSLMSEPDSFTLSEVYYCLLGAYASYRCGDMPTTRKLLEMAAALALPHGFIVPFAEHLQSYGGILENLLQQEYPEYHKSIVRLWTTTWKGWMSFHNRYTHDNIATVLTPQEHHVALLLSRGATYEETAAHMHLSTGRIRNIASVIYGKLFVKNKRELKKFIY